VARPGQAATNLVRSGAIPRIELASLFLREHGAADEHHVQAFAEPLAEITDAGEADAILLTARITAKLYLGMLDWAGADRRSESSENAA
jgi:hypothetical protein